MSLVVSDAVKIKTLAASKPIKGERAKAEKKKRRWMDGCSFRGRNKKQEVAKGGDVTIANAPFPLNRTGICC